MNEFTKKILRSAGILCAIGAVGGFVIAGVNVITGPIIAQHNAEAAVAAYKAIFPDILALGDPTPLSGKYVTKANIAYKDVAKTEEIGTIYTGTSSNGHTHGIQVMVGFSKNGSGATIYGKIVILDNTATAGYGATVVENYVNPYNAAPSGDLINNVSCGATEAATAIKLIVNEAKTIFESVGPIEDVAAELKTIFPNEANYDDAVALSGQGYAQQYYAVYSDEAKKTYLGSAYRLKGTLSDNSNVTLLAGFSGSASSVEYGKIVLVTGGDALSADVSAYNAAPSASQFDTWTAAADGAIVKSMMAEAADLYSMGTGNLSQEGRIRAIFSGTRALSDPISVNGHGSITSYQIAYGDAAKSQELGYIFTGTSSETFDIYTGESHTATITLAVGIKGTAASPILGRLTILSDDSFEGTGMGNQGYVDDYNADPSTTTLGNVIGTGATHSASVVKTIVTDAVAAYQALKN